MKKKNMEPAVMTLSLGFDDDYTQSSQVEYIDLSQIASLVNRRFYRQGINWAVAGFKVITQNPGKVTIRKLPNSWITSNAWEKAFRAWNRQQKEALEEAGGLSAMAKFRDFKVFMDTQHVDDFIAAGSDLYSTNLLPFDSFGNFALDGEWEPSRIVLPNTVDVSGPGINIDPSSVYMHMVGENFNPPLAPGVAGISRGVLEGYADSRAYPQSPDPVSPNVANAENWLRQMFNVGNDNEAVTELATDVNDELPYDQVNYPGGQNNMPGLQIHDFVTMYETNPTFGLGVQRLKGGNFPCGLISILWDRAAEVSEDPTPGVTLLIDLIPGDHRGYLCEPMTEM